MLSVPPERPVDPAVCSILEILNRELENERIDYFLIGASARDLLMYHVFEIRSGRATKDTDFAIALKSWNQFERINERLIQTGRFSRGQATHRMYFDVEENQQAYPIDLVPFGGVEEARGQIAWPPEGHVVMNVIGYEEALQSALLVEVCPGLITKVVSLPALAALKVFAWKDRGDTNRKDAQDLLFLLKNYTTAGNYERIFDNASLLEACSYDSDLAGAALLGFDCRVMMGPEVVDALNELLEDRVLKDRLVLHMNGATIGSADTTAHYLQQFQCVFRTNVTAHFGGS